jgi:hypothetical protein
MAPELLSSVDAAELREIAQRVREWQQAKQLSDAALCKKYTGLGSTKTFKRILDNDLKELDLEKQITNYRTVWALIESLGDDDRAGEELYLDLTPVVHFSRVLLETMRESGIARFILMLGDTGSGKTSALRLMLEKYGQRLLSIEASVAWNDSPMALLGAVLAAFGDKNPPYNLVERLNKVLERLRQSRICIFIDEGHHLGPRSLNLIKTLINQTPGEFAVFAKETLWKKLELAAYEEVKQLTKNRLAERIYLKPAKPRDIEKMIERRVDGLNGSMTAAVKMIVDRVKYGNLAFAREVIKRVNEAADGEKVTLEMFSAAVTDEVTSREGQS